MYAAIPGGHTSIITRIWYRPNAEDEEAIPADPTRTAEEASAGLPTTQCGGDDRPCPMGRLDSDPPEKKTEVKIQEYAFITKKAPRYQGSPSWGGVKMDAVLARTTIDMDTGNILEDREVLVGRNDAHIFAKIKWPQKRKVSGKIRTIRYFDPGYKTPDYRNIDGKWYRTRRGSMNPGLDPESWSRMG